MIDSRLILAIGMTLASVAGCQAIAPVEGLHHSSFALGVDDVGVATAGRPVASQSGELRVSFQDALSQLKRRRILSTLADVDHVVVTVTPTGGSAVTQTVAKAAIATGQTTVSFTGLPVGPVEVEVLVYDVSGATLGTSSRQASIVAGQIATVDLFVQLPATVAPNGGGSSPSNGGLSTNVFIQEGAVITNLPGGGTVERYKLPAMPVDVAVDSTGAAWVLVESGQLPGYGNIVYKLSPAGAMTLRLTLPGNTGSIVVDAHDHVWASVALPDLTFRMGEWDSNGDEVNSYVMPGGVAGVPNFAFDGVQTFYASEQGISNISRWAIGDATLQPLTSSGKLFSIGKNADMWITLNQQFPDLVGHMTRTGDVIDMITMGVDYQTSYSAVDATGNVWVSAYQTEFDGQTTKPKNGKVVKLSPSGAVLKTTMLAQGISPQCVQIAPNGTIWLLDNWLSGGHAMWLDANGDLKGSLAIGDIDPWNFAVGSSGAWVLGTYEIVRVAPAGS